VPSVNLARGELHNPRKSPSWINTEHTAQVYAISNDEEHKTKEPIEDTEETYNLVKQYKLLLSPHISLVFTNSYYFVSLEMPNNKAPGYMRSDGNGSFSSQFILPNGEVKTFNGRFSSAVPAFTATASMVEYDDSDDLGGECQIGDGATVGSSTVNLTLMEGNGSIQITGNVNPFLDKLYAAYGAGIWSSQ